MSLPTWTPDALSSEVLPYANEGWRLVEAQHRVSTLPLVDNLDEQAALEDILEETKPVIPQDCAHLDPLLFTPFRYGTAYPHGSRFRRAGMTLGVFYASEEVSTAVAELAFYRLLFFAESPGIPFPASPGEYTAFSVALATERSLDLARPNLSRDAAWWTHPIEYEACQTLAETARKTEVVLIRYTSVRDPERRANAAVLVCAAFSRPRPLKRQTWRIRLSSMGAQAICEHPNRRIELRREDFEADPRIAALNRPTEDH